MYIPILLVDANMRGMNQTRACSIKKFRNSGRKMGLKIYKFIFPHNKACSLFSLVNGGINSPMREENKQIGQSIFLVSSPTFFQLLSGNCPRPIIHQKYCLLY